MSASANVGALIAAGLLRVSPRPVFLLANPASSGLASKKEKASAPFDGVAREIEAAWVQHRRSRS